MSSKKFCPYLYALLSMLAVFSLGCGKKAGEESRVKPQPPNPQLSDLETELEKQELFCGADRSCPGYITKIAFNFKGRLRFCTGFLMDQDMVVTSSSCLPERLKMKDVDCSKDAFFFFAEPGKKPTRMACDKVLEVSQLEGKEPFLWRSDVAYLKLAKKVFRYTVSYPKNRTGMNDMDKFYTWGVDQIDSYQGIIRKTEDCQPVLGSFFNPLSANQSSPVITMAGCEFSNGNSGAPILDYRGKVRAIVSRPVDPLDIDEVVSMRILDRPLKPLIHVSNYACAPVVPHQEVMNENECNKKLDITTHDLGQRDMMNEALLFKTSIQRIEHQVTEKNRYLKMAVTLSRNEDAFDVSIRPKCFKDVARWIGEFNNNKPFTFNIELPVMSIKKSMNEYGKIYAQEYVQGTEATNFQFRPSILRSSGQTTVFMWSNGPSSRFDSLSESCSSLF